jgi:predicted type IV restriction endonuclease
MDYIDKLRELASHIPQQLEHIRTEEATKTALILPFISAMGYDIHNPTEVTPEIVADVGVKKGEKCDYAILQGGKPIILFECKSVNTDLNKVTPSQLYRYFSTTGVRFGILTNGIRYHVYSDFEQQNKMDQTPFLELDMLNLEDVVIDQFKQFTKPVFKLEVVLTSALEYKYTRALKRILKAQVQEPSRALVRLLAEEIHTVRMTDNAYERFSRFVKRAWHQLLNDLITERLKAAMTEADSTQDKQPMAEPSDRKVVTTAEELEAYYVTKAILREVIDPKRVAIRDALSYCAILFDDNNRKPICRLYFNASRKSVGFFGTDKREERVHIDSVDDLYKHADRLKAVVAAYMSGKLTFETQEMQQT